MRILFYSSVKTKKMFSIQSYYRNDIQILKDLGYEVYLSKSIKDFCLFWKYDIAFLYFYRYAFFASFIAKCFKKKVYFTGGIDYLEKSFATPNQRRLQIVFFKLCNLFSDKNILVSTTDYMNVKEIYKGEIPNKCIKSYHIIDFPKFKFNPKYDKKENIITTIAWMVNLDNVFRKGVDKTIKAFSLFVRNHSDYKLVIAGPSGKGSEYILHLIEELNLFDKVEYRGSISENEKIKLLKKSKIYTQLSIYEGFGIASIEALAAGNIVIHSGNGGLKDAIGDNGYIVDINDINSIAAAMESAVNTINNSELIVNAVNYVKENFSYNKRLSDFKSIISL